MHHTVIYFESSCMQPCFLSFLTLSCVVGHDSIYMFRSSAKEKYFAILPYHLCSTYSVALLLNSLTIAYTFEINDKRNIFICK